MQVTAKLKYLRIGPRKVRLVADLIRKKKVEEAQAILDFTTKKATEPLLKLLKTAITDARHNFQLEPSNLYISKIIVDEGSKYKRWMPRARGMASQIQKRTSHITLVLDEIEKGLKKAKKRKQKEVKKEEPIEEVVKESSQERIEIEKPKFRPEIETTKPKIERGLRRIFRRKAF